MSPSEPAPEALQVLYQESYRPLVAALRLAAGTKEDAEEIAQEAFTRLIMHWARVSEFDDPMGWVRMVAFRLVIDRRRRLLRSTRWWTDSSGEVASDMEQTLDVERAVARLPLTQRQVVLLHYIYDLRVEDVARILNVRIGTVKSRLGRARAALSGALHEEAVP